MTLNDSNMKELPNDSVAYQNLYALAQFLNNRSRTYSYTIDTVTINNKPCTTLIAHDPVSGACWCALNLEQHQSVIHGDMIAIQNMLIENEREIEYENDTKKSKIIRSY